MLTKKGIRAFSLIELMVVIAVVAILAAVAIPSYQLYCTKIKIIDAYKLMNVMLDQLIEQQDRTISLPSNITFFDGTSIASGTWTIHTGFNFDQIAYYISSDGQGAMIQGSILGLDAIPDYVASNGIHVHSIISLAFRTINGTTVKVCGTWSEGNDGEVPLIYQPTNCTCNNVSNFLQGGSC
jgi:prepilin-type N-terminal cleavage/methylation domain-containing protein